MRRNAIIAGVALVVVAIGAFLYWKEASKPGVAMPIMAARNHVAAGSVVEYNSYPPTNGSHVDSLPQFTVYSQPITNELAVHGLEDGGVIINYKPDLDKETVDKLASIATSYTQLGHGAGNVIMYPYTYKEMAHPIVLTSWGRMDSLDTLDEARIRRFISEYVGWDHHEGKEGQRIP